MGWFGLLWVAALAVLPVRVTPVTGEAYAAQLRGFADEQVQLSVGGESRAVPLSEITRLERTEPTNIVGPTPTVALRDGSRLRAESVRIEDSQATIRLRRQDPLVVPVESLAWVRFRAPSPGVDDAWLGMVGEDSANDRLVIRRSATSIDQMPGVVTAADDTRIEFNLGSQVVPAPVARLEGVVFAGGNEVNEASIVVTDTLGSQWAVTSMATSDSGEEILLTRADGSERALRMDQLHELRISGNTVWLASESPVAQSYTPLVDTPLDPELVSAWLGVRTAADRDLILRSRSSVTYRVDPETRLLAVRIVPDASVSAGAGAVVRILLDDEVAWSETVAPADPARGVELNVGDARRVTFEVDFGDGEARGDSGDVIRFVQPRLLR